MNERKQHILESLDISNTFEKKFKKRKQNITSRSSNFIEIYKEKFTNYINEIKSKIDKSTSWEIYNAINFTLNKLLLFFGEIISNIKNYENILIHQEETIRKLYKNLFNEHLENEDLQYNIKILSKKEKEYELIKEKTGITVDNNIIINVNKKENEILILRAENSVLKEKIKKRDKEITYLKNNLKLNRERNKNIKKISSIKTNIYQNNKIKQDNSNSFMRNFSNSNSKLIIEQAAHTSPRFYPRHFSTNHITIKYGINSVEHNNNLYKLLSSNNIDNYKKKNINDNILISDTNFTETNLKQNKRVRKINNTIGKNYFINSILSLNNGKIKHKTFLNKNHRKTYNNVALKTESDLKESKISNIIYSRNHNKKETNCSDYINRNNSIQKYITITKNNSKGKRLFKMKGEFSQEGLLYKEKRNIKQNKNEFKHSPNNENTTFKTNKVMHLNKNSALNDMDIKKFIKKKLIKMKNKRENTSRRGITSIFSLTNNGGSISSMLPMNNKNITFKGK